MMDLEYLLRLSGGWLGNNYSMAPCCGINGIIGHEIHFHSDPTREVLRVEQMRNTDREK